jgi:hypothetical protein
MSTFVRRRALGALYTALLTSLVFASACSGDGGATPDAAIADQAIVDQAIVDQAIVDQAAGDRGLPDSLGADQQATDGAGVPLPGFGALSGECGVIDDGEWNAPKAPAYLRNALDFGVAAFDETQLSTGGQKVFADGNLGGNSLHSEVFAYEVLYRCELATLLKTEKDIKYQDAGGKKTDLLVEIDGRKVGVSVTRAFHYPPGQPYTAAEATKLLERKLPDVLASALNAKAIDAWERSMLHVIAADAQHADVVKTVYDQLDAKVRANTWLLVTVTDGKDDYIY